MKKQKRLLTRVIGILLVALLAFSFAVPTLATENLRITIHNAEGLPAMKNEQFYAFQIFSGTPNREGEAKPNDWNAQQWDNWTLADVGWGSAFTLSGRTQFMLALNRLNGDTPNIDTLWPGLIVDGQNVFAKCGSIPAKIVSVLVGKSNAFLQAFCRFVLTGSVEIENKQSQVAGWLDTTFAVKSTATNDESDPSNDVSNIEVHDPGYYLITENFSDHGEELNVEAQYFEGVSEFILAVLGNQDIYLKASVPTVDKSILTVDEDTKEDQKLNGDAAGIGDTVQFLLDGKVAENITDYTENNYYYSFHDTLSKGLTFSGNVKVYVRTDYLFFTYPFLISEDKYSITLPDPTADGTSGETSFSITFEDLRKTLADIFAKAKEDSIWKVDPWGVNATFSMNVPQFNSHIHIYVVYEATLNSDAVIGSAGNPNDVYLEYSNDPNSDQHGNTTKDKVYVYSFGLDLTKKGSDSSHDDEGLPGAGFLLSREVDGKKEYAFFETDVKNRKLKGWTPAEKVDALVEEYNEAKEAYLKAKEAEKDAAKRLLDARRSVISSYLLTSGVAGKIPDVTGLDEGTYTLTEVVTPDGYNTMEPFDFKIKAVISEKTGTLLELQYYHPANSEKYTAHYSGAFGHEVYHSGLFPETLVNQKAPFLPFTGGIGTIIFYVLGLALIGGAVAYFVISYRKRKKQQSTH